MKKLVEIHCRNKNILCDCCDDIIEDVTKYYKIYQPEHITEYSIKYCSNCKDKVGIVHSWDEEHEF